jgi:hypothetical protein
VELGGSNDLGEFLHVDWLDIDNVYISASVSVGATLKRLTEALVTDVEVPQVDPQVIGGNVRFLIGID